MGKWMQTSAIVLASTMVFASGIAEAGKETLEEAFIALTGGVDNGELLAWREQNVKP